MTCLFPTASGKVGYEQRWRLGRRRLEAARAEFNADVTYLDTATFGLPTQLGALQQAPKQWRNGTAEVVAYDRPVAVARSA